MLNEKEENQFLQLVEKYVSGDATEQEKAFLEAYYQHHENKPDWLNELTEAEKDALDASLREAIFAEISSQEPEPAKKGMLVYFDKYKVALSIAAMLIIVLGAGFFYSSNESSVVKEKLAQADTNRFKNDVAPGRNGAVLTLADGSSIVLDSAKNGALAIQGSTQIIKKDGQILYNKIGNNSAPAYNTISTPNGRQYNLLLADGSKVWLNATSSITFPTSFIGSERKVSVTGEVYFEVAHNSKMPFVVQKGDMSVTVLGTHFNINAYDDEQSMNVTLLEGAVKVNSHNSQKTIKPGQQARVSSEGAMNVLNDVDTEEVMAWKNELFKFKSTDIGILMRQLSRWYDVEVVYNKNVTDRFFVEIPRNTNLTDILKALELTGRVRFGIDGKKIIVMP